MSNHPRSATPVPADTVLRGRFVANNLEIDSADYPWGVVHLYRDSEPPQTTQTVAASPQPGTLLAILAVPTYMSAADVLSFLGGYREAILHIRTIRDQHPNRYLALLQFQTPSDADHFYTTYSGRAFSSLEPEKCHVVYVNEVLVQPDESTAPVVPARLLELPTCPVCLESLDSSATGLMTILCQHTFHCQCLFRWGDGSCPVCRYSANRRRTGSTETTPNGTESTTPLPEALPTHLSGSSDDDLETQCAHCGARDHLWICLICAHIGCGRYQAGHAHQHFEATGHLYSLELESQRVWDYANEGYVHRLIQNRADGKLVELPEPNSPSPSGTVGLEEKVQSLNTEFAGLLDSQLESQRQFYESQIDNLARDWYHTVEELRATRRERSQWMKKYQEAQQTNQSTRTHLLELETTKHRFDKRVDKLSAQVAKLEQRWTEEAELNKALSANQSTLKGELAAKDQTIAELQEQVQDLMAYLSMQQKVASDTSLQGADVVGVSTRPSPASSAAARATPTKGRKKK
ncbi:BRCA1-associated protein 2-domain-containing protein [Dimargaris cristalligena]|uniref:BRCA1-associated protein 2-domain-containing protein n=1 Tax=Dimargaris cristalligena TaxID=215637 RepID=A0A4P9ZR07_9FUNG|nr:BRCA1-associated protein 2-domain-containing protein [Dimargaris cristalligena]|eukprot:RKP35171.1 BRCA1-associated protein 2-domain-containing protein [Dimargaris cristalligena]